MDSPHANIKLTDDCTFKADKSRTKQIFENLFRNAIEHEGEDITVRGGPLPNADGFPVGNSGPMIPKENRDKICDT